MDVGAAQVALMTISCVANQGDKPVMGIATLDTIVVSQRNGVMGTLGCVPILLNRFTFPYGRYLCELAEVNTAIDVRSHIFGVAIFSFVSPYCSFCGCIASQDQLR